MGILKLSTVSLAFLLVLGCSSGQNSEAPPPPPKTVFDPLTQQEQKARDVQKTVDSSTDAARKSLDRQEGGDAPQ